MYRQFLFFFFRGFGGGGVNLSLKIMLLSPAWYGKPYWKNLKLSSEKSGEMGDRACDPWIGSLACYLLHYRRS